MSLGSSANPSCPQCNRPVEGSARFCRYCGTALRLAAPAPPSELLPAGDEELVLPAPRRIQVEGDRISLRALQQMVTQGVEWWQMRLQAGEATREEAISRIEELRKALGSVSHQLAQGRETIRITTTLTPARRFPIGCPRCGKGNRINARYCIACGRPFAMPTERPVPSAPGLGYSTGLVSDTGAKRSINQDSGVVHSLKLNDGTPILCCIVADGMGGANGGERASALASMSIIKHLQEFCTTVDKHYSGWRDAVRAAIVAANSAVFREAEANPELRGMGTTVVLSLIIGETGIIGSVGDSRVYLLNKRGVADATSQIAQITVDHTMVARLVDIGQLTPEQARTHPRRNVLYRSVGVEATVECDVTDQPLQHGDWLLLCSDGLTNELSDEEIRDTVFNGSSPQAACATLIAIANGRGARDNVTALTIRADEHRA